MSSVVKKYGFIAVLKKPLDEQAREAADEAFFDEKIPLGITYDGEMVYVDWNRNRSYSDRENFYGLTIGQSNPEQGESLDDFLSLLAQRSFDVEIGTIRPFECIYYNGGDSPLDMLTRLEFMEQIIPHHTDKSPIRTFEKEYDGESMVDVHRDVSEAFSPEFTPVLLRIPSDEHGFFTGNFKVTIDWEPEK